MKSRATRLLLAAVGPRSADISALASSLSDADWLDLAAQAESQALAPLVWHRIKSLPSQSAAASECYLRLCGAYDRTTVANSNLLKRFAQIAYHFSLANIPIVALKGAYLAERVYGDLGLRPMNDIDVMVPRSDLEHAQRLMLALDYGPKTRPSIELDCSWNLHLLPFFGSDGQSVIELHWTIEQPTSPFVIDLQQVWRQAESTCVAGRPVAALSLPHFLIHLCLHAAYHHGFEVPLRSLCDIAWLITKRQAELEWQDFVAEVRAWRADRVVYVTLAATELLFGTLVPREILADLSRDRTDELMARVVALHVMHAKAEPRDATATTRALISSWYLTVTGRHTRDDQPIPVFDPGVPA